MPLPSRATIYLDEPTRAVLDPRIREGDALSATIRLLLTRYAEMVRQHMPDLSAAEWGVIAAACMGQDEIAKYAVDTHPGSLRTLWAEVAEYGRLTESATLRERHGMTRAKIDALALRLRDLPYVALVAVRDRVDRFWATDSWDI